jgi:hypothetical protein
LAFFLGGVLLEVLGFRGSLWVMAGLLCAGVAGCGAVCATADGQEQGVQIGQGAVCQEPGYQPVGRRRVVLFGARDVWFVVGVPVFLYASGWSRPMVGGFLAAWTIGYGAVQAFAPHLVRRSADGLSTEVPAARLWSALLAVVTIALAVAVAMQVPNLEWVVVGGLGVFGFAFAVNSSVHSYLILAYAGSEKAAEDVGFYYAANAAGRFFGTLMSGLLYQWGGLLYALVGSAVMLSICWAVTLALPVTKPVERISV